MAKVNDIAIKEYCTSTLRKQEEENVQIQRMRKYGEKIEKIGLTKFSI